MIVTKYYCDICEKEIQRDYVGERFMPWVYRHGGNWKLEVMVHHNDTANKGMLCFDCLKSIFTEGKEL